MFSGHRGLSHFPSYPPPAGPVILAILVIIISSHLRAQFLYNTHPPPRRFTPARALYLPTPPI
ncbi:hypothetical protein PtA15_9A400 [Puccinia triticina]|uniref:Uncharacterized protein n=1 Tax=Puccinia triticina TaxID=208348 RepID=A0ABY7CVA9_9BASI|nr:uncharacterized protein PtA15_9A400 [Puccinia triticina]WAQ88273.1 hypothetical protein PtA15_9A400 [Puccinia triticina]